MGVRYDIAEGQVTLDGLSLQLMGLAARLDANDLGLSGLAGDIAGASLTDLRVRIEALVGDIVETSRLTLDAVEVLHNRTTTVDQAPGGWPWVSSS